MDFGINLFLIIESDSSRAKAFVSRKVLGKQLHVQTRYLWTHMAAPIPGIRAEDADVTALVENELGIAKKRHENSQQQSAAAAATCCKHHVSTHSMATRLGKKLATLTAATQKSQHDGFRKRLDGIEMAISWARLSEGNL